MDYSIINYNIQYNWWTISKINHMDPEQITIISDEITQMYLFCLFGHLQLYSWNKELLSRKTRHGCSLYLFACSYCDHKTLRYLESYGVDYLDVDENGDNGYHFAFYHNNVRCMKYFDTNYKLVADIKFTKSFDNSKSKRYIREKIYKKKIKFFD